MLARDPVARAEAVRDVLHRYAEPLKVYVRGSTLRRKGDPVDLVQGFLASRLARDGYLDDWIRSGLPLRRWLINGLHLYSKEEVRRTLRKRCDSDDHEGGDGDPAHSTDAAVDAEWARTILQQACELVRGELEASGHLRAWDVFQRHFIDGRSYRDLQSEFGLRPAEMAEASRRVANLLREHVRLLLVRDGVAPEDVESELRRMLAAMQAGRKG